MKDLKLIMVSAKQGGGKSTLCEGLAEALPTVATVKFAAPIYEMHDQVLKVLNKYTMEGRNLDKRLLQLLGTEWGRDHIDTNIWVNCLRAKVQMCKDHGHEFILVDDLRFKNEFDGFDCIKIRLEADEINRKARCSQWRETSNHPSETDLDSYVKDGKFDLVIHTDVVDKYETLSVVLDYILLNQKVG